MGHRIDARVRAVVAERRETIISAAFLLHIGGYLLVSMGGLVFPAQPAFAVYHISPDTPSNPRPDGKTVYRSDVPLNVSVSDPDGQDLDVTFWDDAGGPAIGTVTGVPSGTRATISWSDLSEGTYSWKAHACESNGGDNGVDCSSNSSVATFTVDIPPNINNPRPEDGEGVDTPFANLSARYTEPGGEAGTLRFYNATDGTLIGTCGADDGDRCWVNWSGLEDGSHDWYVVAEESDGTAARSDTWTVDVLMSQVTPITGERIALPDQPTTIQMGNTREIPVRLSNPLDRQEIFELSVETSPTNIAAASIVVGDDAGSETVRVEVGPEGTRVIQIAVEGASCYGSSCSGTVTLRGEALRAGVRVVETTDIVVRRNTAVHQAPGITLPYVVLVMLAAAALYARSR